MNPRFKNGNTFNIVIRTNEQVKDLNFRDHVVLMILKADVPQYWPSEDPFYDGSRISLDMYLEPLKEVLCRHFPEMPLNGEWLATRASRLRLAVDLEKKIGPYQIATLSSKESEISEKGNESVQVDRSPGYSSKEMTIEKTIWPVAVAITLFFLLGGAWWRWVRGRCVLNR